MLYLIKLFITKIQKKNCNNCFNYLIKRWERDIENENNLRSIINDYFNAAKVNAWEMRKLSHNYFQLLMGSFYINLVNDFLTLPDGKNTSICCPIVKISLSKKNINHLISLMHMRTKELNICKESSRNGVYGSHYTLYMYL